MQLVQHQRRPLLLRQDSRGFSRSASPVEDPQLSLVEIIAGRSNVPVLRVLLANLDDVRQPQQLGYPILILRF
jgi:hypothetical protein